MLTDGGWSEQLHLLANQWNALARFFFKFASGASLIFFNILCYIFFTPLLKPSSVCHVLESLVTSTIDMPKACTRLCSNFRIRTEAIIQANIIGVLLSVGTAEEGGVEEHCYYCYRWPLEFFKVRPTMH